MFKILNISFICFMENGEESGCIRKGSRDSWTLGKETRSDRKKDL